MNPQLRNQILIGILAGALVSVLTYFILGSKRDDLTSLENQNVALQQEVNRGNQLKANYENLKKEVDALQKRIDELIKIMPTEMDRSEIMYRVKKLADMAGVEQVSFKLESPQSKEYYSEYPVSFVFRAGYHTFGQFASLISGYDKIINMSDITLIREKTSEYSARVTCKISAFIYKPAPVDAAEPAKTAASGSSPKPSSGAAEKE